jgi:tetratricopeptide (TPR) repeat protein
MLLRDRKSVQVAFVVVLGMLIYANTFHVPFYFDDYINLLDSPLVKNLSYFVDLDSAKAFNRIYGGFVQRYFGYLTFALNYRFNGLNVTGYHLVNIVIHLAASLLVYRLVILTFRTPYFSERSDHDRVKVRAGFIALFAALLFVAHPIQTQAVTYIVQRFASLAAMLYLLSLTCYIRARLFMSGPDKRFFAAVAWFAAALVSAVLALKTKEIAFTLPLVVVLYELLFFTGNLKRKLFALVLALVALVGSVAIFSSKLSGGSLGDIISNLDRATRLQTALSRWDYLATECRVLVTYLRLLLFPSGQRLIYDYPTYHTFFTPAVLLSAALLSSLLAAAVYCVYLSRKDSDASALLRLCAFGIFWFFITISIESSIIPIADVIFEHRLYLPSAGLFMAAAVLVSLAGGAGKAPGWPGPPVLAIATLVILILAGATVARNQLWRDEVSFWQDNAEKSPHKSLVFHNLGIALENRGNLAGAEQAYQAAAVPGFEQGDALVSLGLLHIKMGRLQEAQAELQAAVALIPGSGAVHNNIGIIHVMLGKYEEALKEFILAARLMPNLAETYNNIGKVYTLQKRYPEALKSLDKSLSLDPDYEQAYINRGMVLLETGRKSEAVASFRRALEINPTNAEAAGQLQKALKSR